MWKKTALFLLTVINLAVASTVSAATRALMQGIPAERAVIHVSTINERVTISTNAYGDGLASVGLYTTSNVVVGDGNAAVIYATGSFTAATLNGSLSGSKITGALPSGSVDFSTITTALNTLSTSTETLRVSLSTNTPRIAAFDAFLSTHAQWTPTRASTGTNADIQSLIDLDFASTTIAHVSTITSSGDIAIYTDGGSQVMKLTSVGMIGSTDGCFADSTLGTLDLCETTGGDLYLRRYDTSVNAGDDIGRVVFRDRDSSTGGTSNKASITAEAAGAWSSGNPMEVGIHFGLDRYGSGHSRVLSITSTGTYIRSWQASSDVSVACDTCTLHVQGNASVTGTLQTNTLKFNDGTTQTTAAGASMTHASMTVVIPTLSTNQTTLSICYATATISASANAEVTVWANIAAYAGGTTNSLVMTVLEDGQYVSPLSSSKAIIRNHFGIAGAWKSFSFKHKIRPPTAGTRNYCLVVASDNSSSISTDDTQNVSQFGAEQWY